MTIIVAFSPTVIGLEVALIVTFFLVSSGVGLTVILKELLHNSAPVQSIK